MKLRYLNIVFILFIIIGYFTVNCAVRTIINTKTAPEPLTTNIVLINADAVYDPSTGLVDLTMDNTLIDGNKYEIYIGEANNSDINTWGTDVSGWSCVCDDCGGGMSFGLGGGGGSGGGGGNGFGDALKCGMLGMHILIDTNDDGMLDSSAIIKIKIKGLDSVAATDGTYSDRIEIDWQSHPDAVGGYSLYRSENPDIKTFTDGNLIVDLSEDFYTDNAPIGGNPNSFFIDYYYAVKYITSCGEKSDFSNCDLGYLQRAPGPDLTASDSTSQTQIDVSWTNNPGVTGWMLQRRDVYINNENTEVPFIEWRQINGTINTTSYSDVASPSNVMYSVNSTIYSGYKVKYYYRVRGIEGTPTDWSNIDEGSISDNSVTMVSVVPAIGENKLRVTWSAGTGTTNNYYQIQRSTDDINFGYLSAIDNDLIYDDAGISPDITYYYRVVSRRDFVWGTVSLSISGKFNFTDWEMKVHTTAGTNSLTITGWDNVPGAEGYIVERSTNMSFSSIDITWDPASPSGIPVQSSVMNLNWIHNIDSTLIFVLRDLFFPIFFFHQLSIHIF